MTAAVKVTLLGRDFEVAPYKLGAMRQAAPIVDRINAAVGSLTTLEGGVAFAGDLTAFVSIGLLRLDDSLTPERLEEELGMADIPALQAAFRDILLASGMKPGEAQAPSASAEAAVA